MVVRCIIHACDMKARVAGALCRHHAVQVPGWMLADLHITHDAHQRSIGGLAVDRIEALAEWEGTCSSAREWLGDAQ